MPSPVPGAELGPMHACARNKQTLPEGVVRETACCVLPAPLGPASSFQGARAAPSLLCCSWSLDAKASASLKCLFNPKEPKAQRGSAHGPSHTARVIIPLSVRREDTWNRNWIRPLPFWSFKSSARDSDLFLHRAREKIFKVAWPMGSLQQVLGSAAECLSSRTQK